MIDMDETRELNPIEYPHIEMHDAIVARVLGVSRKELEKSDPVIGTAAFGGHARETIIIDYSWAIPSHNALLSFSFFMESLGKKRIIEIGAGRGYWAHLINQMGINIKAFDNHSWGYKDNQFFPVKKGDCSVLANKDRSKDALFLVWPPYRRSMAADCLNIFEDNGGELLFYVGEGEYGCNANSEFFNILDNGWTELKSIFIPQWNDLNDYMSIWKKDN